jgi:hypothetical protein
MSFILLRRSSRARIYMRGRALSAREVERKMLDLILVAAGTGAFILAALYTAACEKM